MVSAQSRCVSVKDGRSQQSGTSVPVFKYFAPIAQTTLLHLMNKKRAGRSPLCAYGLHSALYMVHNHIITQDKNICTTPSPRSKQLLQKYPKFVAALWAFLCTPRTKKDLIELDDELSDCHCKYSGSTSSIAMLHADGHAPEVANDPFKEAIAMAVSLMGDCVFTVRQGYLDNPDVCTKGQSLGFESMCLHLIHQPDTTIEALASWYEYTRSSDVLLFILYTLRQKPTFMASVVKSCAFLATAADQLGQIVSMLKFGQKLTDEDKKQLASFNMFFAGLLSNLRTPDVVKWFSQDARALYDHFYFLVHQDIFDYSLQLEFHDRSPKDRMLYTASLLRCLLPESESLGPPLDLVPDDDDYMTTVGIGRDLPRIVREVRTYTYCFYPGCSSNRPGAPPLTNCPLPRCKGCSVFTFCSSECHRLAWDFENLPHKRICPTMKRVFDAWCYFGKDTDTVPDEEFVDRLLAQEGLSRHSGPREDWTGLILEVLWSKKEFFTLFGLITLWRMGVEGEEDMSRMYASYGVKVPSDSNVPERY